tara:strand:+ start:5528 stop:5923 length:396 start_codon:yes stop_codon:yes gene_type:complete
MKVDVAIGEVFDRITILDLKIKNIQDEYRLSYIKAERDMLLKALAEENIAIEAHLYHPLYLINSKIWETEAGFRDKESKKEFDSKFVEFARLNARYNDERFIIKNKINEHYNSEIREQKSYDFLYEANKSN